jgi:putative membrane protein
LLSDWPVWFVVKFLCLILMSAFHMWLAAQVKVFARDANERGHVAFRVANELPTALMVIIVVMVIVKPFV